MSNFRTKKSFEKAFKLAVTNFNETKIWFEHPSRSHSESKVCFVLDGKLAKLPMYKAQYYIDIWKNHFIEFLKTGKFDYNGYWMLYEDKDIAKSDIGKVFKFPLCNDLGNQFYEHSDEQGEWLDKYRKKYPNCGIKQVTKPLQNEKLS